MIENKSLGSKIFDVLNVVFLVSAGKASATADPWLSGTNFCCEDDDCS